MAQFLSWPKKQLFIEASRVLVPGGNLFLLERVPQNLRWLLQKVKEWKQRFIDEMQKGAELAGLEQIAVNQEPMKYFFRADVGSTRVSPAGLVYYDGLIASSDLGVAMRFQKK